MVQAPPCECPAPSVPTLLQDVADSHPGLSFLREAEPLRRDYVTTVRTRSYCPVASIHDGHALPDSAHSGPVNPAGPWFKFSVTPPLPLGSILAVTLAPPTGDTACLLRCEPVLVWADLLPGD